MVSIVVPVYNVEKYLDKCVQSLVNQTYKDIEILLIDDGSTDNSGQMCDEYAKQDNRITVYHKENGGLSDARNYGMDRAMGEYILFVDSDDYIELDMVEFLISKIGDCDMATCGVFDDYPSKTISSCTDESISFETDNLEAFRLILVGNTAIVSVCCKLIKTEMAKKQRFRVGKLYEDAFFNNELMFNVKNVSINTKPLYHYVHREGSITTSSFKSKDIDVIKAYEETVRISKNYPQIQNAANFRLCWAYFVVLDRILLLDNYRSVPEYNEVIRYLKAHAFEIMRNNCFAKSRRIAALALKVNVRLYRVLLMVNYNKNKKLHD